ncbi:MAG: MraY family glycosyltransferase [Nitrospirota bacterium]
MNILNGMDIKHGIALSLMAFLLSVALTPLAMRVARQLGAMDMGGGRNVHTGEVPRLGGLSVMASFFMTLLFFGAMVAGHAGNGVNLAVAVGSVMLVFAVGFWDDVKRVRVYKKLSIEIIAAGIAFFAGFKIRIFSTPFGVMPTQYLSFPLTVFWIIVITNAINLIDGLDGIAAGTGIFVSISMLLVSPNSIAFEVSLALIGSLAGFLIFNYHPAKIFMGDSGSLTLGFILALLSINSYGKSTAFVAILASMTIFSVPILDMAYAVMRRYYRGVPLGQADKEHIHHKLLEKGLSKRHVIMVLYGVYVVLIAAVLLVFRMHSMDLYWYMLVLFFLAAAGLVGLDYVKLVPMAKEMVSWNIEIQKKKYYLYLIRRFQRDAEKRGVKDFSPLWDEITNLLQAMEFRSIRLRYICVSGKKVELLWQNPSKTPGRSLLVHFSVDCADEALCDVRLRRNIGEQVPVICLSELINALSRSISNCIDCMEGDKVEALKENVHFDLKSV